MMNDASKGGSGECTRPNTTLSKSRHLNAPFVALLLLAATALPVLSGCAKHSSAAEKPKPSVIVVALDRSNSMDAVRSDQLNQLDLIATVAIADEIPLDVWVYDSKAERIWGPRVPMTRGDLLSVKSEEMTTGTVRRITRPALMLEALNAEPDVKMSTGAAIIVLTDGDSEVWQDTPRLRKIGDQLGALPGARIGIFGIRPENRKAWEAAMTPGFSDRYSLAGPSEVDAAIRDMVN